MSPLMIKQIIQNSFSLTAHEKTLLLTYARNRNANLYDISRDLSTSMGHVRTIRDSLIRRGWAVKVPREVGPDWLRVCVPEKEIS